MTDEPDRYVYWRNALNGVMGPIHDGDPQCGYYKQRIGPKWVEKYRRPYFACAIWWDGEKIVATRQLGPMKPEEVEAGRNVVDASKLWTYVCETPITEEQFYAIVKDGKKWPTEIDALPEDPPEQVGTPMRRDGPAPMGDNNPPEPINIDDPIRQSVDRAMKLMELKKFSEDDVIKLRTVQERLRGLAKKTEAKRVEETAPHLQAQRDINAKFAPMLEEFEKVNGLITGILTLYLNQKQAKLNEEHAAKVKKAAAEAAALAAAGHAEEASLVTVEAEPPKARIEGAGGKAASIRTTAAAQIDDYDKALLALSDRPEMRALVQQLADRAARAGVVIDGTSIIKKGKAV